jgi:hypothetical protein
MAILKGRVDGLEYKVQELSAGQFSSSTKMSGGAVFTTGAISERQTGTADDKLTSEYNFTIDLNTSFNGSDGLYTQLVQGNQDDLVLDSAENTSSTFKVGSLFYTFPVGDFQVTAGPLLDADDVISATTSIYSGAFRLAAMPWGSDGDITGAGAAVSWANDSGFNASFASVTEESSSSSASSGIFTKGGADHYVASIGYDTDNYGGGLIFTNDDNTTSSSDTSFGAGVYFRPDNFPTISFAYDSLATGGNDAGGSALPDSSDWLIGLDYEVGPGTASAAYQSRDDGYRTLSKYEIYYNYPVNDGITVQGGFFAEENQSPAKDTTGVIVETFFSF